jgi:hypothetical protein
MFGKKDHFACDMISSTFVARKPGTAATALQNGSALPFRLKGGLVFPSTFSDGCWLLDSITQ